MLIKQISIFIENKSGRLTEVTKILGHNNIDLIAISISDTTDFGILRLIVNDPNKAESVLKENGFTVNTTNVIAIAVDDIPGSLADALAVLSEKSIGIEYMYAVGKDTQGAVVILRVEDIDTAIKVLREKDINVLKSEKVYQL
ncbi:MAG: ACT domain-containing protein [Halanaerobiaceae bacterium]